MRWDVPGAFFRLKRRVMDMGKNKKKKESYYDADQSGRKFGKWNFIMLAAIIIIEAVLYYVLTPTINFHSVEFWIWMIVTVVALFICTLNLKAEQMDDMPVSPKLTKIVGIVIGIMILAAIVGWIGSSKLFAASKYAGLIRIEDGKAYMEEANCPDGYCEEQGKISGHTQTIVCLPHKLVVEVLENESDQNSGTSDSEDAAPDTIAK